MSLRADGSGMIAFREVLDEEKFNKALKVLDCAFRVEGDRVYSDLFGDREYSLFNITANPKYEDDVITFALKKVSEIGEIDTGCIKFKDQESDRNFWQLRFKDGEWLDENVQFIYNADDVMQAAKDFGLFIVSKEDLLKPFLEERMKFRLEDIFHVQATKERVDRCVSYFLANPFHLFDYDKINEEMQSILEQEAQSDSQVDYAYCDYGHEQATKDIPY